MPRDGMTAAMSKAMHDMCDHDLTVEREPKAEHLWHLGGLRISTSTLLDLLDAGYIEFEEVSKLRVTQHGRAAIGKPATKETQP